MNISHFMTTNVPAALHFMLYMLLFFYSFLNIQHFHTNWSSLFKPMVSKLFVFVSPCHVSDVSISISSHMVSNKYIIETQTGKKKKKISNISQKMQRWKKITALLIQIHASQLCFFFFSTKSINSRPFRFIMWPNRLISINALC